MIPRTIVHLVNELPLMVDLLELPAPDALSVRCTNVRTVDGKRPQFVHNPRSTFIFPMSVVRLIEAPEVVPAGAESALVPVSDADDEPPALPDAVLPEEDADEDLLARIRSV